MADIHDSDSKEKTARGKKIGIVTGASAGLGKDLLLLLDQNEDLDEIWAIARRKERLEALNEETETPVRPMSFDLTEKDSFRKLSEILEEEKPDVRYLINAAGMGKIGDIYEVTLEDGEAMIDLNCRAAVGMTKITVPYMSEGSHIAEICSTAAFQPFRFLNIYAASKAFLYRYSRALRLELFHKKIMVTAVCPYWIKDTEFIETARKSGGAGRIKGFPLASESLFTSWLVFYDIKAGVPVSLPGPIPILHRIAAKLMPSELMMCLWELIRKI